jgi:NADH dehydrogenase
MSPTVGTRHHVVIIGSGFGGLFAAKHLKGADVDITLISRVNHHLFQPLLYQVATGILSEGEIAPATREILRKQANVQVLLGDVTNIDLAAKTVTSGAAGMTNVTSYDSLIVAAGADSSYFGHPEFAPDAPGLKSIDDAMELRARIFGAFEAAELEPDPELRKEWMTFVVVGAGPTGVEMAGQLSEASHRTLKGNFRTINPADAHIILLDAAGSVLGTFGHKLSAKAAEQLEKLGVEVWLNGKVVGVDARGLDLVDDQGHDARIATRTIVWAAGVQASPLGRSLGEQSGAEVNRAGQVAVRPDLTLPGHPEVYVIGDLASLHDYPGVAQVAMQGAKYAADSIQRRVLGQGAQKPFKYFDKGSMATISRFRAVANVGPLRFFGFAAWVLWLGIHIVYLVGFKNRTTTLLHWAVSFIGNGRSQRAGVFQQAIAGQRSTPGRGALSSSAANDANAVDTGTGGTGIASPGTSA